MLTTSNEEVMVTTMVRNYLPPPWEDRTFAARNMVRLAARIRGVPVVTQGVGCAGCKVQVTYDGIQWTVREITS